MMIDADAPLAFLQAAYQRDDWVAVFLKSYASGRIAQRVAPLCVVMSSPFQAWLAEENQAGVNVYCSVNPLRERTVSRRRMAIRAIRHVFLDADHDGSAILAAIAARRDLPPPSYVLHSSKNRIHVFWRVVGFTIRHVEAVQKQLVRELDTDPAATSCAQMTRLPGFVNHKWVPPCGITMEYRCLHSVYTPSNFPTPLAVMPRGLSTTRSVRSGTGDAQVLDRARRYLATMPPAITGQGGDRQTFRVCCRLVRGFALSDQEALTLLMDWNARCEPPWRARDLIEKLVHARRYGREPIGGLLESQR